MFAWSQLDYAIPVSISAVSLTGRKTWQNVDSKRRLQIIQNVRVQEGERHQKKGTSSCFCLCSFCFWGEVSHSWISSDMGENFLLGNRKKIAKFLMRTFACHSTFLYSFPLTWPFPVRILLSVRYVLSNVCHFGSLWPMTKGREIILGVGAVVWFRSTHAPPPTHRKPRRALT